MFKRLTKWFFVNLLFALLPLLFGLFARFLVNTLNTQAFESNLSEVIFFSIMTSITAMTDLDDIKIPSNRLNRAINMIFIMKYFLLFGAISSSVTYGFFVLINNGGIKIDGFGSKLIWVAVPTAIVVFIVGTISQVLIVLVNTKRKVK